MRINMLLDNTSSQNMKEAMQLVADNPSVIGRAMVSLQEKLGLDLSPDLGQAQEAAYARGR
jgi:hypothetical protein